MMQPWADYLDKLKIVAAIAIMSKIA